MIAEIHVLMIHITYTNSRAQLFKTNDVVSMLLVKVSLKFQMLISQVSQYCFVKLCEKLLQLLSFFQQKYQCSWL